jgi:uncharacterized protein
MTDDGTAPRPGHYLPGGAGDATGEPAGPVPVHPPEPDAGLDDDGDGHLQQQAYRWTGASAGRHSTPAPPPYERPKTSRTVIAGFAAAAMLFGAGGIATVAKMFHPYDGTVSRPLTAPSMPPATGKAEGPSSEVTVTVTATPTPDALVVKKNDFYSTGKLVASKCAEPDIRPTSRTQVSRYFQAMLPCLNKSWAPTVRKSGHQFRAPHLVVFNKSAPSPCTGSSKNAFYCGTNETIYMPWPEEVEEYREADRTWARIDMAATLAHEYGHHVQKLTGILDASQSRQDGAPTKAGQLLESRRIELQAECLSAVYLGANKRYFPIEGRMYDKWEWRSRHHGDEYNDENVRDHGSRESVAAWSKRGFETADPKSCNTFTAPASKVS